MAHVISDECINCGACASVCPVECFCLYRLWRLRRSMPNRSYYSGIKINYYMRGTGSYLIWLSAFYYLQFC